MFAFPKLETDQLAAEGLYKAILGLESDQRNILMFL